MIDLALAQKYGKVAVIMGGDGPEREVSLISGERVLASLIKSGVNAYAFDPGVSPIHELIMDKVDRAFMLTHGKRGEDGLLQGVMEYFKIPYTNSGVLASSLSMDKFRTKLIWQTYGIPMPRGQVVAKKDYNKDTFKLKLDLPVIVKPVHDGSTLGLSKVYTEEELISAIDLAFLNDHDILIEEMIVGSEYTITVMDGKIYPIIKIEAPNASYDYHSKYFSNETKYFCPYDLGDLQASVESYAKTGYEAVGARGVARLDFMLDMNNNIYFLEINTIPGMTPHSLVPQAFAATGVNFDELCLLLLDGAKLGD